MSFGELSGLPSKRSAITVIEPSCSVRVTRRESCSQVSRRPWRSRVLPLALFEGLRNTLTAPVFFLPLHDPVVRDVAPEQVSAIADPHRPFAPAHARGDSLDLGEREPVAREAWVDDLDERVGIALTRLPLRERARHHPQRGDPRPLLKELPFAPFHGSPFVEQRILVIGAALLHLIHLFARSALITPAHFGVSRRNSARNPSGVREF